MKNIPLSVNDRLSRLSSSKEIFDAAAPAYQEALRKSGYEFKLEYKYHYEYLRYLKMRK